MKGYDLKVGQRLSCDACGFDGTNALFEEDEHDTIYCPKCGSAAVSIPWESKLSDSNHCGRRAGRRLRRRAKAAKQAR